MKVDNVSFCLLFGALVSIEASSTDCGIENVESSPDGSVKYIPSSCESLSIYGDSENLEAYITAVEMHPSLTSLSFAQDYLKYRLPDHSSISQYDIVKLFEILPNTNIDSLSLAYNKLGDKQVEHMANMLSKTKLVRLNLKSTSIDRAGSHALAAALRKDDTLLQELDLSLNNVGPELLEAVKSHSKLDKLGLEGTSLGRSQDEAGRAIKSLLKGECAMSPWGDWKECEGSCGSDSTSTRSRSVLHQPHSRHGNPCSAVATTQSRKCRVHCDSSKEQEKPKSTWSSFFGSTNDEQDNAKAEKMKQEQAKAEQFKQEQAKAEQLKQEQAKAEQLNQEQAKAEQLKQEQAKAEQMKQEQAKAEQLKQEQAKAEQLKQEQAKAEQLKQEQAKAEQLKQEQAKAEVKQNSEQATPEEPAAPSSGASYKTRLENFYRMYNPTKLDTVDMMLSRFEGREEVLFSSLVTKYGAEPEV